LHLSHALFNSDGKQIGVVVAVMGIEQLEQQYTIIKLDCLAEHAIFRAGIPYRNRLRARA
jgi:rRNA processing protein Gar1